MGSGHTILPSSASGASLPDEPRSSRRSQYARYTAFLLAIFFLAQPYVLDGIFGRLPSPAGSSPTLKASCEQAKPLYPQSFDVSALVQGQKDRIVTWLSDAVKIPTESFDVMGEIGEDPRWDVFYKFAEYLEKAFPRVHEHLTRTRVMTHALIFEWQGSDPSLKPLLLTGHQDVVPVLNDTRGMWTHDPFGGEYDGERIWGRGSTDDKSGLIGIMSAVELLLESGKFDPRRTVILALGCDEETGGKVGAYNMNIWLEGKYGKDSMAILVDEGNGMTEMWGQLVAAPAVGEKGYMDVELKVETLGGHSSVPPPHTGIGYISLLIAALEQHPHKAILDPRSPILETLSCGAATAPKFPKHLRRSLDKLQSSLSSHKGKVDKKALKEIEDWFVYGSYEDGSFMKGLGKAMISTTQAVDIIYGGLKVNALPESVSAVINHRINIASSVAELQQQMVEVLAPVAFKLGLSMEAFGKEIKHHSCHYDEHDFGKHDEPKAGKVILNVAFNHTLEPAPVSPYTLDSPAWRLLSGTVRSVYESRPEAKVSQEEASKEIIMAPAVAIGNTDTQRYWGLTRNIYRFAYMIEGDKDGVSGIHTINEYMPADGFVELVRWFMNLIVNVDESKEI
ncbi:hypothetical protein IAU60_006527 [Kwoniella sp. DSM 27419]